MKYMWIVDMIRYDFNSSSYDNVCINLSYFLIINGIDLQRTSSLPLKRNKVR